MAGSCRKLNIMNILLLISFLQIDTVPQYAYNIPGWQKSYFGTSVFDNSQLMDSAIQVENPGYHKNTAYNNRHEIFTEWFLDYRVSSATGQIVDSVWTIKPFTYDTVWCKEIVFWDETNDKVFPIRRMEVNFLRRQEYPSQYFNDRKDWIYFIDGNTAINLLWYKDMRDSWVRVKTIY